MAAIWGHLVGDFRLCSAASTNASQGSRLAGPVVYFLSLSSWWSSVSLERYDWRGAREVRPSPAKRMPQQDVWAGYPKGGFELSISTFSHSKEVRVASPRLGGGIRSIIWARLARCSAPLTVLCFRMR
jgi:hypothetical protein